jgi:hypothetical protein
MDWIFPLIVGWCGTGWPHRFWPKGGGGGGGFDPDNPWPVNCPMCGGIVASLGALVIDILVLPHVGDVGIFGRGLVDFAGGAFASGIVGGLVGMMRGNRAG